MQSGQPIYDFWMNDSDFIGTHPRYNDIVDGSLTDFMAERRQGRHQPAPRPEGFHRPVLRHLHRRQALSAARPAVREPLLVPLRLVPAAGAEGAVQAEVRLRTRRAGQLVGLRGHRRLLHQRREGDRRRSASMATWITARRTRRSAGASPMPGCRWPAPAIAGCRTASRSTSGASATKDGVPRRLVDHARRRCQRAGGGLCADEVRRVAQEVCAARSGRHGLPGSRPGAGPGPYRAADLLVQRPSPHALSSPALPVMNADGTPKWRMAP